MGVPRVGHLTGPACLRADNASTGAPLGMRVNANPSGPCSPSRLG